MRLKIAELAKFQLSGISGSNVPAGWVDGPTVIIRLSQFNLPKFYCQLEQSLAINNCCPLQAIESDLLLNLKLVNIVCYSVLNLLIELVCPL